VSALSSTLAQLNEVFLEKEETSVIRVERLEHELAAAAAPSELAALHHAFIDFHGEVGCAPTSPPALLLQLPSPAVPCS
jgi:hypothetical protein